MRNIANKPPDLPRLLVSVRNLAEANLAIEGGCDILDLKEPSRGSLGMVDREIAEQVVNAIHEIPVSVALGELSDWQNAASIPAVPAGTQFCKIGLSGQARNSGWKQNWKNFRDRVDEISSQSHRWIAVGYADFERAESPPPDEILEAASDTSCAGILLDTYTKTDGNLFAWFQNDELRRFATQIRSTELLFAVAGSLQLEQVPRIHSLQADIVAVRGAVCNEHCRTSRIEADLVRRFKQELEHSSTKQLLSR